MPPNDRVDVFSELLRTIYGDGVQSQLNRHMEQMLGTLVPSRTLLGHWYAPGVRDIYNPVVTCLYKKRDGTYQITREFTNPSGERIGGFRNDDIPSLREAVEWLNSTLVERGGTCPTLEELELTEQRLCATLDTGQMSVEPITRLPLR